MERKSFLKALPLALFARATETLREGDEQHLSQPIQMGDYATVQSCTFHIHGTDVTALRLGNNRGQGL